MGNLVGRLLGCWVDGEYELWWGWGAGLISG